MDEQALAGFYEKMAAFKLFEYPRWSIYLEPNQYYLGRVFAWAKRPATLDLFTLTKEEWDDLQTVLADCRKVQTKLFKPDLFNVSFLGNVTRHCHGHLIPRYVEPRKFLNHTFIDAHFGKHYNQPDAEAWVKPNPDFHSAVVSAMQQEFRALVSLG